VFVLWVCVFVCECVHLCMCVLECVHMCVCVCVCVSTRIDNPVLLQLFLLPRVGGWFAFSSFFKLLLSGRQLISFLDNKVFKMFSMLN
jgi:hypothetical protein